MAATDPITPIGREVGRLAVIVNADDIAVMGVRPLAVVGATLVGGDTEIARAVTQPVAVGQMIGVATHRDRFVSTAGAHPATWSCRSAGPRSRRPRCWPSRQPTAWAD